MKRIKYSTSLLLLLCLIPFSSGCLLEDRVVELVVTNKTCNEFPEDHGSEIFVTPTVLDYGKEIDEILSDKSISKEDIVSAKIVSMYISVTEFSHDHDWSITGEVSVERVDISDGPYVIFDYDGVSVAGALGVEIPVDLNEDGVGLVNRALGDFIDGTNPVLRFTVSNGDVIPDPSSLDRIVFTWKACMMIHIISKVDLEVVDPI